MVAGRPVEHAVLTNVNANMEVKIHLAGNHPPKKLHEICFVTFMVLIESLPVIFLKRFLPTHLLLIHSVSDEDVKVGHNKY